MAIPLILRAASLKAGSDKLILASRLNKVASNPMVGGLARATQASRVPLFNETAKYISSIKSQPAAKAPVEKKEKVKPSSSSEKNKDKAKTDAEKNQDRQDKAEKESQRSGDENASLLRVIAKDTVRVRDAVESLVKQEREKKSDDSGGGLLGKLGAGLTSFLPALLGKAGMSGPMIRMAGRAAGMAGKLGGTVLRSGGSLLKMGGAAAGAIGLGKLFGKADDAADAVKAAPKGILGKAGELAGKAGGMFGKIAGKGGGTLGKGIAKAAGKSLIKKIPIIGAIAGLGLAANRAYAGDWTGAGLEAASGLAGTIPGIGTAASLGLDAALLARDMSNEPGKKAPAAAKKPAVSAAPAASPAAVVRQASAQTKTVVNPLQSMAATLSAMLVQMTDKSKGIYVCPADEGASTLQSSYASTPTSSAAPSYSTSSIGPVTRGKDGLVSGESMHAVGPAPGSAGLGSLSALYESGKRGSSAVGWDSTGGTSYGKYQIASRTGTMKQFMEYLRTNNPEAYSRLAAAGDPDAGKNGQFAQTWKQLSQEGVLGNSEHDFIKKSHYDVGFSGIKDKSLQGLIGKSSSLQDVLWSTSVQHGGKGASGIFNKVYRNGMNEQDLIQAIYAERGTRFGSSTAKVRASVQNRFADESRRALAAVGTSPTGMVREQAVASSQARQAPIVIAPQQQVAINGGKGNGAGGRSAPAPTPVIVRNPDSPVRNNVNTLIRTT